MPDHCSASRRAIAVSVLALFAMNLQAEIPLVIAHRGASKAAPENTRSALLAAIDQKAPVIEFDVRETSDGKLALFHDESLERIVGRKESVGGSEWKFLRDLDVGKWFGDGKFAGENPILLEEALQICVEHDIIALVEHKSGSPVNYAEVIRNLKSPQHVIVQSFQWDFLKSFQDLMPEIPLGALGSKELSGAKFENLESLKPQWVGWKHSDLKTTDLERLQDSGFRVALWTVNRPEDASKWVERGVDAIITDLPGLMRERLSDKSPEP